MKRKTIKLMTTTLLLSTMLSFSSLAAWEQSEQGWKYKDDNTQQYVTDRWIESVTEKGLWYYIGADGIMATNTLIDDVYYVNELGEWREGSSSQKVTTPTNNEIGDIDKSKCRIDLDDWDPGSLNVEDILGEETANSLAEALDRIR